LAIYFDYNATTPLDSDVRKAMLPYLDEIWGNPSSVHQVGRQARAHLDEARERAAVVFGARPSEIVFTSGGTESSNLAVLGTARHLREKGRHIVCSAIEHHAVLHAFDYLEKREDFEVTRVPVNSEGLVDPEQLAGTLRNDTILVSVMAANNEIGTVQPVSAIGEICNRRGVVFHTDAVQWVGKMPFDSIHQFHADLVSVCAHKLHGPKGSGALFIRSGLQPHPTMIGGGHENEKRAGTENLAGIIGLVEVLERFVKEPVFNRDLLLPLSKSLAESLAAIPGVFLVSNPVSGLPNTVSVTVEGSDSIALLAGLDLEGVCASSGSACSAGSLEPSHVIRALGLGEAAANSLVRFSLGRQSTLEEVDRVIEAFKEIVRRS
jgi:cysteine desulfurase